MTTDSQGRSARIYQFPVRTAARGAEQRAKPVMEVLPMRYPATASGSGWYHEAAIQEAELAVKQ
jgi:hypothetical protein